MLKSLKEKISSKIEEKKSAGNVGTVSSFDGQSSYEKYVEKKETISKFEFNRKANNICFNDEKKQFIIPSEGSLRYSNITDPLKFSLINYDQIEELTFILDDSSVKYTETGFEEEIIKALLNNDERIITFKMVLELQLKEMDFDTIEYQFIRYYDARRDSARYRDMSEMAVEVIAEFKKAMELR